MKIKDIFFIEHTLEESAPPSEEAEAWIKANKERFKKKYGKDYERVLYAKAWKLFGEKK